MRPRTSLLYTFIVDELPLQGLDGECVNGVHLQIVILLPGSPRGVGGLPLVALFIEALDLGLVLVGGPPNVPFFKDNRNPTLSQQQCEELEKAKRRATVSLAAPTCRWTSGRRWGICGGRRSRCPPRRRRPRRRRPPAAAPAGG